ncbi:MAG: dihydropteroate synthase [Candidatus Eiseniibacteriota bacterium]
MKTVLESRSKTVVIGDGERFVIIGERINPTGRKMLAAEMKRGELDRVRRDAVAQVDGGAHVLDVNAGVPGVDEAALLAQAVCEVMAVTDVPVCIDSSVVEALGAALEAYQGKALVNSVTGEDERLERILPLVRKHGAAVIGIANDDTGISMVPEERLAIARKIVERAQDHGVPPKDVVIDPIAMTVGASNDGGVITLETIRLIRENLGCNMSCGASNVSFGLPDRDSLNAAFLPMAIAAGLTSAITNPLVPAIRKAVLATDLLLGRDDYAASWIAAFRAGQRLAATP